MGKRPDGTVKITDPMVVNGGSIDAATTPTFDAHSGIDLPDIAFGAQTTLAYPENAPGTGGTLTVSDSGSTATGGIPRLGGSTMARTPAKATARIHCCKWGTAGMGDKIVSILRFVPTVVFHQSTEQLMDEAFDAACRELRDENQSEQVHEIVAKRIMDAVREGERSIARLREFALAGLVNAERA
jgi:hypothetical protein